MKLFLSVLILSCVVSIVACKDTKRFASKEDADAENPSSNNSFDNRSNSTGNDGDIVSPDGPDRPNNNTPPGTPKGTPLNECSDSHQHLLIIDLKSGWWAGDGGQVFEKMTKKLDNDACENGVSIDYRHVLKNGGEAILGKKQYTDPQEISKRYNQVWILSGSVKDKADIDPSAEYFQDVIDAVHKSDANVFIGAGFGSVSHGNAFAAVLLEDPGYSAFEINVDAKDEGRLICPDRGFDIVNNEMIELKSPPEKTLFKDVDHVADVIDVFSSTVGCEAKDQAQQSKGLAFSDKLNPKGSDGQTHIDVHLKCKNDIACIGTAKKGKRKMVFDSGLQRFYHAVELEGVETLRYMQNIIQYLSRDK